MFFSNIVVLTPFLISCVRVVAREQTVERFHVAQEALAAAGNGAAAAAVASRSASVQASKNTIALKPSTRMTKASSRKPKSPVSELKASSKPPSVSNTASKSLSTHMSSSKPGAMFKSASQSPSKLPPVSKPQLVSKSPPPETSPLVLRSPSASKSTRPVSSAQGITEPDSVTTEVSAHTTQLPGIRVTRGGDERDGGDNESKEEVPAEVSASSVLQAPVDISGGTEDELNHSQDDNGEYSVSESGDESKEEYLGELDVSDTDSVGPDSVVEECNELYT
ncbi:hypothetical protein PI124_g8714 [Phytophthora idaei]|nr:hypothetical protein PI124_g8714 [Phytophthora idaei]